MVFLGATTIFLVGRISAPGIRSDGLSRAGRAAAVRLAAAVDLDDRALVLAENPGIIPALTEGAKFGGEHLSTLVAQNLFSYDPVVTEEIREKTTVAEVADRTWLIRLPIVNVVLFETDDGLVLIDTGMAAAGPVIREVIEDLSDLPLRVIVYTHYHVDHAYGAWALTDGWGQPVRIIAQERLPANFDRYRRFSGLMARLMSQPGDQITKSVSNIVYPTETIRNELVLEMGGEDFIIRHYPGETEDQLFIWAPDRRVLASADYYQGFLPNAGNGKRVQRHVEEWADALVQMADLEPAIILPGHGPAMTDPATISEELRILAEALKLIVEQVVDGLNSGLRVDEAVETVELPEGMRGHHALRTVYATPQDIARMVAMRYTGWWDGLPSSYNPPTASAWAKTVVTLSGGLETLIEATYEVGESDVAVACRMADIAWLAAPEDPPVHQLVLDIYGERISTTAESTQEMLAYLDHMTVVRGAMR